MGLLSLVFAGISIVLAVGSVTTQNVVGRFSLRMLRLYQRDLRDKAVIGVFALAASFIMSEQIRLRRLPPDALAPVPGVTLSLFLIFASGVMTIWYLSVLSEWFRVDKTARRVSRDALSGARALQQRYADLELAGPNLLLQPDRSTPILAPRSGHLAGLDFDLLVEHATELDGTIVIDRLDGASVLRGEPIGWMTSSGGAPPKTLTMSELEDAIDLAPSLTLEGAVDYRIVVLVDIAIMALSPSVNDPNTAVQIIDEMTFLFAELAKIELGPVAFFDDEGTARVVVDALSFADYLDLATEQVVLYGISDPAVERALDRLISVLSAIDLPGEDRDAVERLRGRVTEGSASPHQAS